MANNFLEQYSDMTRRTAQYPIGMELPYLVLGLTGEAGEVANKVKKIIRGDARNEPDKEIAKELGDVYWYLDRLCHYLGTSPEQVMRGNMDKLLDRLERDVIMGSGDSR